MKIFNFSEFLNEEIGYSEEVEKITKFVINYIEEKEKIEEVEEIEINIENSVNLNKIIIQFIDEYSSNQGRISSFDHTKSKYSPGGSYLYLKVDFDNITLSKLNHEIFHGFDWLKNKGKDLTKNEEMSIISLYDFYREEKDEDISKIINIFYNISSAEIRANFNETVYLLKDYLLDNKEENIKDLIEETNFYEIYQEIKDIDLKEILNDLSKEQIDKFISLYEVMLNLKEGEEETIKIKQQTVERIDSFFDYLIKLYNKQLKEYKRYLMRLYSKFNN